MNYDNNINQWKLKQKKIIFFEIFLWNLIKVSVILLKSKKSDIMNTIDKLKILSQDSQYDLACACGTTEKEHRKRGLEGKWLYPVSLPYGGQSIMLKTLLANTCTNDTG